MIDGLTTIAREEGTRRDVFLISHGAKLDRRDRASGSVEWHRAIADARQQPVDSVCRVRAVARVDDASRYRARVAHQHV